MDNFHYSPWVMINKFDLNVEMSDEIENYCRKNNISFVGKLPFDANVVEAMVNKKSIIEYSPDSEIANQIAAIYDKITTIML